MYYRLVPLQELVVVPGVVADMSVADVPPADARHVRLLLPRHLA